MLKEQRGGGGGWNHKTKSCVKGLKLREPYLVLPLGLDSEDRHAIHLK